MRTYGPIRWIAFGLVTLTLAGCGGVHPVKSQPAAPVPVSEAAKPAIGASPSPAQTRPSDAELLALPNLVPKAEPRATRGNPPFYEVYGVSYTIKAQAQGFVERGVASWYGPDFHGLKTSTGEPYDMYGLTAAHKTLPLPAYVEVTNLKNGKQVVVRVNDRGPFKANRIIDLSYTAALKLGMLREGTSLVEIRVLDPGSSLPAPPPAAPLYVQAGAFTQLENANRLKERLTRAGFSGVSVFQAHASGQRVYRVRVGPIATVDEFDQWVSRLQAAGVNQAWLSMPTDQETTMQ